MKKIKILVLGIAVAAVLSLTGCSNKNGAGSTAGTGGTPGWKTNVSSPVKFD